MTHKTTPTSAADPGAEAPVDLGDNDTVYDARLTGRQIDLVATLFDQVIRANGVAMALQLVPVLEAVTASRKAALQKAAAKDAKKEAK